MSEPGWYPDPAGSGGVRYWDGHGWGGEVRASPGQPAPHQPAPHQPSAEGSAPTTSRRSGGRGWVWLLVVAVVVAIVVVVSLQQRGGTTVAEDTNSSVPTVSQWDETSYPSTSPPSSAPSSLDPSGARERACENLAGSSPAQTGDRVSSGGLSFPAPQGWTRYTDRRLPFSKNAYGLYVSHPEEQLGWASTMAVAQVNMPDGYPGSSSAATRIAQCLVTSEFYTSVEVQLTEVSTESVDLDGTPGTRLRATVRFDDERLHSKATVMNVIVVDTPEPTVFISLVKSEAAPQIADLEAAVAGLRVG